jgi:hypothetical protein
VERDVHALCLAHFAQREPDSQGRTVDIDETFFDIVHDTIGKGGQLFAAMAQAEARHGPFAFFGDVVWEQFAIKGGGVVARNVRPGITAGLAATGELRGKMAIAEAGAAYRSRASACRLEMS